MKRLESALKWCKKRKAECGDDPEKWDSWKREKNRMSARNYQRERRRYDVKFRLNGVVFSSMRSCLKRGIKGEHWEDLVGYSIAELRQRLKRTIPDGFMWQDFLDGQLHIDHIIPISAFNFSSIKHIDFQKCWALENLRLLPKEENRAKAAGLENVFQPSLKI